VSSLIRLVSIEFAGRIFGKLAEYGLILGIARLLGADGLGVFTFGIVVLRLSSAGARIGLDTAVQKFIPKYQNNSQLLTGTVLLSLATPLVVGCLITASLYFGQPYLSNYGISFTRETNILLLGIPLYGMFRVGEAATRGFKTTREAVIIREFTQRGGALVIGLAAALVFNSIVGVVIAYLISLTGAVILSIYYLRKLGAFERIDAPTTRVRELYAFAGPAVVIAIAHPAILWSDVLVLGTLTTNTSVGVYEAAYQTALWPTFALVAASSVFPALVSDYYHNGRHDLVEQTFEIVTKWVIVLTGFATLYLAFYAENVLRLFGSEFQAAKLTFLVLLAGQSLSVATGPVNYLLTMTGHEKLEMVNTLVIALLNISLNIILITDYGILGAAIATAISIVCLDIIRLAEVRLLLGLWPYSWNHLRIVVPLTFSGLSFITINMIAILPVFTLLLSGLIGGIVYLGVSYLWIWSDSDEFLLSSLSKH